MDQLVQRNVLDKLNEKYDRKIQTLGSDLQKLDEDLENVRYLQYVNSENNPIKTLEDVSERNNSILKEVLMAKARLRSRAIYNPAEVTWCAVMQNYKNEPALPGIQWQCLN